VNELVISVIIIIEVIIMMVSVDRIKDIAISIAPKYSIKKIDLFGSYADETANDESDIDFLVEFESAAVSLFLLSKLKYDLEELLGKPVDVIHGPLTDNSLIEVNKVVSLYE
jgi:predicted nucleotidyltransferase